MRRLIDGHVHIVQPHDVGYIDPISGIEILPYGKIRRPSGAEGQRLPAYMGSNPAFPVESLIAAMDENGVQKAVVMAHLDSEICETAINSQNKYPERLACAISVLPDSKGVRTLRACKEQGIRILKFELRSMAELYPQLCLTSAEVLPLLADAERLSMIVAVDPGPTDFPCYRPDCLKELTERFPGIRLVICHVGYPLMGLRERPEVYARWKETIALGIKPQVMFDVTAIPDLFLAENYPYPEGMTYLRELYETVGADKLIWGTDMPGTFRTATYTQMITAFERVDFLSDTEKDRLFYANADKLYFSL